MGLFYHLSESKRLILYRNRLAELRKEYATAKTDEERERISKKIQEYEGYVEMYKGA